MFLSYFIRIFRDVLINILEKFLKHLENLVFLFCECAVFFVFYIIMLESN